MQSALLVAIALAAGITVAEGLRPHPALAGTALLLAMVVAWAARRRASTAGLPALVALLLVVALAGGLRHAWGQTGGRGSLAAWTGQRTTLTGTVISEPELGKGGRITYLLVVESPTAGRVQVSQRGGGAPVYGERVRLVGRPAVPAGARVPGGFDQAAYLARQSVYLVVESGPVERLGHGRLDPLRRAAVAARLRLEGVLKGVLPPREAALLAGLLLGSRSDLPADLTDAFKRGGVFHLLAVSGGNVAMVVVPFLWGMRRLGLSARTAAALAIPLVLFFIFLTGASPSVVRAGLMAMLVLLGDLLRRERNALNTLGAAAAILLLSAPAMLFDLGFQFSAGATLGILLLARPIEGWLLPRLRPWLGERGGGWLAAGLSVTLAAQVMVEPLSLHAFGAFSLIAPLSNLLVLTFVERLVPLGSVVALVGLAGVGLVRWTAWLLGPALNLLIYAVKAMSSLPFAYLEGLYLPVAGVVLWYGGLLLWLYRPARESVWRAFGWLRRPPGRRAAALALLPLILLGVAWRGAFAAPADQLVVTFLDVGQGDAALIEAPGGRRVLVDAGVAYGPDPGRGRTGFDAGERVVAPFLAGRGIHHLDHLILTHPDADHVGGAAAVMRAVTVGHLLLIDPDAPETGQAAALALARQRRVQVRVPVEGERIDLGGGVLLELLGPPEERFQATRSDDNANCIAFRLRYRQVAMLFACDLEAVAEERLVRQGKPLRADLLKVSHHGSGHSSTAPFLAAVAPRYALVSVGAGNRYGHPATGTLGRLTAAGAEIWRTDTHGTVTVKTDGFRLTLAGSKGSPAGDGYRPLALWGRPLWRAW